MKRIVPATTKDIDHSCIYRGVEFSSTFDPLPKNNEDDIPSRHDCQKLIYEHIWDSSLYEEHGELYLEEYDNKGYIT
jgi:hypothetical protein